MADAQFFITRAVELIADQVVDHNGGEDIINPDRIDPKYPLDFVIYELLSATYGFKGDTIDSLCASLRRGATGKRFYSASYVAYIDRGRIVVTKIQENDDCRVEMPLSFGKVYCGNSVLYIEPCSIDDIDTYNQPENVALIDADTLGSEVYLRRWQAGDSFIPLGMEGHKKVSDFLIDCKVSMAEKERQFVLMSGEDISVALRSLNDDFACIVNTYLPRYKSNPGKVSPENNIDCPIGELNLVDIVDKKKKIYRKAAPKKGTLNPLIVLSVIVDQANINESGTEIKINTILTDKNNAGKIFSLDVIALTEMLYELQKLGYIKVNRTAGLDVIKLNDGLTFDSVVKAYYESLSQ